MKLATLARPRVPATRTARIAAPVIQWSEFPTTAPAIAARFDRFTH